MSKLTFYRHYRIDGSIRTGVEINEGTVLHLFEKGEEESDPVLRWFVDIRCEGKRLPTSAEEARQWLLKQAPVIHRGLQALADEFRGGIEPSVLPVRRPFPDPPRGIHITLVCSARRRVDGLEMAQVLDDIDKHWEERLEGLSVYEPSCR